MEDTDKVVKLRAYWWRTCEDGPTGLCVIAKNIKDARRIGAEYWGSQYGHEDADWFIQQRCVWVKKANIHGLSKGVFDDDKDGLIRGLFGYCEDMKCPRCGELSTVYYDKEYIKGGFYCGECEDKDTPKRRVEHCDFCSNTNFAHIADDLYACPDCEKIGFIKIYNTDTKKYYWKKTNDTIVDFETVVN